MTHRRYATVITANVYTVGNARYDIVGLYLAIMTLTTVSTTVLYCDDIVGFNFPIDVSETRAMCQTIHPFI